MYHRGDRATARDLFDLALVIEKEPGALREAAPFLVRHREAFLAQVSNPGRGLMSAFEAIDALDFRPTYRGCVELASDFLLDLRAAK